MAKTGRPRKHEAAEALQKDFDKYFKECDKGEMVEKWDPKKNEVVKFKRKIPYTVIGLILSAGYADRQSFQDLEDNPIFSFTIKKARARIEHSKNMGLLSGEYVTAGAIFDLKNNHKWTDKNELAVTGNLKVYVVNFADWEPDT